MLWLAAFLALLAVVLLAPVRLRVLAASDPARLRVDLRLFWGRVRVALIDSDRPRRPRPARRVRAGKARRLPAARLLKPLLRAALEALRRVRIERLRGEARVGLGDPALTGEFWGRAGGLLAALPSGGLRLVADFDRQVLEGDIEIALSLVPAHLLPVAARFLWALR